MGGKRTQPRSCGSERWEMVGGGHGHGPVAPACVAAVEWHRASATAATCPQPPASPHTALAPSMALPSRDPQPTPERSQQAQPLCKPLFWLVLGAPQGAPALCPPQTQHLGGPLAAPLAPHRSGGTRDAPSRGLPRARPPWQHSGHGEPPTVPLAAPPAPPGGSWHNQDPAEGTGCQQGPQSRDLRVEILEWGPQSGDPGTWRPQNWAPQKLGTPAHVAARPH